MENIRNFLESSTIHGLSYISTTRKFVRLLWIIIVVGGFTGAGVLIYNSFQSWNESPVKTTIETLPITKITFPKVTVCPPKNTYTDLNYDLMMTKNMTLDNDIRDELANYAVEVLYDQLHNKIMTDLNKLEDNDRYYNWYHGYAKIQLPHVEDGSVYYYADTYASSGTISTQFFGDMFDADKVETNLHSFVNVYPPESVQNNRNVTLHIDIEKLALKDISGDDTLFADELGLVDTRQCIRQKKLHNKSWHLLYIIT